MNTVEPKKSYGEKPEDLMAFVLALMEIEIMMFIGMKVNYKTIKMYILTFK